MREQLGKIFLVGTITLIAIVKGCSSCNTSSDYTGTHYQEESPAKTYVDTTSAEYLVKTLSHKKHLNKTDKIRFSKARKEVRQEKERLELWALEHKAEQNADRVKKIRENFEENHLSGWDGSCPAVVSYVKKNTNDPESFEHMATHYAVDLEHNCMDISMQFRAKNGFGALTIHSVDAKVDFGGELLSINESQ